VIEKGAGMIVVASTISEPDEANLYLSAAREVSSSGLVAISEPASADLRADVVHLTKPKHAKKWTDRVCGCKVDNIDHARQALVGGCDYLVVTGRDEALLTHIADLATSHPFVWFVAGCKSLADVSRATDLGATRVWMDASRVKHLTTWGNHLRSVQKGSLSETMSAFRQERQP
jgi:hypothetical protein